MWLLNDQFLPGVIMNFLSNVICSSEIMMQSDGSISIEDSWPLQERSQDGPRDDQ